MVEDEDVYPIDTIVRIKDTNEFAKITGHNWLRPELKRYFLNYYGDILERDPIGPYALYHGDIELEVLPDLSGD